MQPKEIYKKIKETTQWIRSRSITHSPQVGMVLGSGLGQLSGKIKNPISFSYSDLPHFHKTSIEGHAGKMIFGDFEGIPSVILQGRFHAYEGHTMEEVTFPTRVLHALGVKTLILTNAAGAINTRFRPCDIMLIEDHINLTGTNPLLGPNLSELGPRFPDMTEAYSPHLIQFAQEAAEEAKLQIQKGIYVGLLGPTYETPAEIKMLRMLGGDSVGMSTVPETIVANHCGLQVCGFSCITNLGAGMSTQKLSHDEVIENSSTIVNKMDQLLTRFIPKLKQK